MSVDMPTGKCSICGTPDGGWMCGYCEKAYKRGREDAARGAGMTETFTSPMPPNITQYTRELVNGLQELAAAHTNDVSRYMGIRDAIKYLQDAGRKYQ